MKKLVTVSLLDKRPTEIGRFFVVSLAWAHCCGALSRHPLLAMNQMQGNGVND